VSGLRDDLARGLRASGAACERKQGDVARALDGDAEPTLMTRAHARHAARKNLAALLYELRKNVSTLVVDQVHLLDTKLADFLFAEILALAAARATWTAARSTWTAFAASTTASSAWAAFATSTAAPGVTSSGMTATARMTAFAPRSITARRGGRWSGSLRLLWFL
jgi:hypothetical protein